MSYRALIVEDDPGVSRRVRTRLRSLGHEFLCAACQKEAEAILAKEEFSYHILDLGIPVETGEDPPDPQNGRNLLEHIVRTKGGKKTIILTGSGEDDIYLGVELMKKGALDYVCKGVPRGNRKSIDEVVKEHLKQGSIQPVSGKPCKLPKFAGGDLVIHADGVTLCGIPVLEDGGQSVKRKILMALADKHAGRIQGSLTEAKLAKLTGIEEPSGPVRTHVMEFLNGVVQALAERYRIKKEDVIESGRKGYGYRFAKGIQVRVAAEPLPAGGSAAHAPAIRPPDEASNPRHQKIMKAFQGGRRPTNAELRRITGASRATINRELAFLRKQGLVP